MTIPSLTLRGVARRLAPGLSPNEESAAVRFFVNNLHGFENKVLYVEDGAEDVASPSALQVRDMLEYKITAGVELFIVLFEDEDYNVWQAVVEKKAVGGNETLARLFPVSRQDEVEQLIFREPAWEVGELVVNGSVNLVVVDVPAPEYAIMFGGPTESFTVGYRTVEEKAQDEWVNPLADEALLHTFAEARAAVDDLLNLVHVSAYSLRSAKTDAEFERFSTFLDAVWDANDRTRDQFFERGKLPNTWESAHYTIVKES